MNTNKPAKTHNNKLGIIIWSLGVIFFLYEFFLRNFIGSLSQQITSDLHLSAKTFALIGSAYFLAFGIMQVPAGILTDKFGIKSTLFYSTLICSLATFLFTHATGFNSAFASRFLMGFGSSFAFICLLIITARWLPKKYFGFFAGFAQFLGAIGPILAGGPLISTIIIYHLKWQSALNYVAIFGILLSILILIFVKNKKNDITPAPIKNNLPLKKQLATLFQNKQANLIALYTASSNVPIILFSVFWGMEYLEARGLSPISSANLISLAWFSCAISCPLLGAFSDISKRRKPTLFLCAILGFISTASIVYLPLNNSHLVYSFLFIILGIAAAGQNIGFAIMTEHVDSNYCATAIGYSNAMITLFAGVIPILATHLLHMPNGITNIAIQDPHIFIKGLSVMPILYLISTASLIFLQETYCKPQIEIATTNKDNNEQPVIVLS